MRLWPESLVARLGVALALALAAVALLAVLVAKFDSPPEVVLRGREAGRADGARAERVEVEIVDDGCAVVAPAAFSFFVRPIVGTVLVAHRLRALPPDVAPVVEVLADGSAVLRRPAPLAQAPGGAAVVSRDGHGAGLVLPAADLAELPPAVRGTVLELLRRWLRERPVPPARLQAADVLMRPRDLRALLRWLP
ncbi:MAG TPA: hypothetical protein ENI87_14990 [bacterium]|nr:hypothetical protein [bacterium]